MREAIGGFRIRYGRDPYSMELTWGDFRELLSHNWYPNYQYTQDTIYRIKVHRNRNLKDGDIIFHCTPPELNTEHAYGITKH